MKANRQGHSAQNLRPVGVRVSLAPRLEPCEFEAWVQLVVRAAARAVDEEDRASDAAMTAASDPGP